MQPRSTIQNSVLGAVLSRPSLLELHIRYGQPAFVRVRVRVTRSSVRTRCGWVPRCWWCCYVDPVSRRKHNKSPVWKQPRTRRGNRLWPWPLSPKSLLTCWRVWPAALRGSSASASRPRSASPPWRGPVCQPLSCWSSIERRNLGHRCLPWLLLAHSGLDSWASCPPFPSTTLLWSCAGAGCSVNCVQVSRKCVCRRSDPRSLWGRRASGDNWTQGGRPWHQLDGTAVNAP